MPGPDPEDVRCVAGHLCHSVKTCVGSKEKRQNIREKNKSASEAFMNPSDVLYHLIKNIACLTYNPRDTAVLKIAFIMKFTNYCIFTSCYSTVKFVFTW